MQNVHFQSSEKDWETPDCIFLPLKEEFDIAFDVCASEENKKCDAYFDRKANSLAQNWQHLLWRTADKGAVWMNPPYGRGIEQWVRKAYNESQKGLTVVALLPARTDTSWFHNYILNKQEVRYLRGRIKFVGANSSAPFPSMVVIFRPNKKNKVTIIDKIKTIWKKLK